MREERKWLEIEWLKLEGEEKELEDAFLHRYEGLYTRTRTTISPLRYYPSTPPQVIWLQRDDLF